MFRKWKTEDNMKKTIVILAAVLVVAALLLNTGCRKHRINITGVWFFTITIYGESFDETYTFVGDHRTGEVIWQDVSLGTYSVSGDSVNFTLEYYDIDDDYTVEVYRGFFDADDQMSGSVTITIEGYEPATGSWIAVR